jgi:hypothetical protein
VFETPGVHPILEPDLARLDADREAILTSTHSCRRR